jgi:hypothetical protein
MGACVLIAAAGVLLVSATATGSAAVAITINTTTHTVTTTKFAIQFGNKTTDQPNDPERIDSLTWKNSHGVVSANLAARGGSLCNGDSQEFWGSHTALPWGSRPSWWSPPRQARGPPRPPARC